MLSCPMIAKISPEPCQKPFGNLSIWHYQKMLVESTVMSQLIYGDPIGCSRQEVSRDSLPLTIFLCHNDLGNPWRSLQILARAVPV